MSKEFPRGIEVVCSAVILNDEGEVLLCRSPKWDNSYITPGGHINPGESILDAVVRETREEVGLVVKPTDQCVACGDLINPKEFNRQAHFIFIDVICEYQGGEVKLDGIEMTEYVWVKPEWAIENLKLGSTYREVLENLVLTLKGQEEITLLCN